MAIALTVDEYLFALTKQVNVMKLYPSTKPDDIAPANGRPWHMPIEPMAF